MIDYEQKRGGREKERRERKGEKGKERKREREKEKEKAEEEGGGRLTYLGLRQNRLIFATSLAENRGETSLLNTITLLAMTIVLNVPAV